ncbi:hypothetical protein LFL96_34685 (plasmid) [Paraburkholderia sp. D15]|uniref:hypothetical protein n=1 Tax=Paraburkholderia sp. D15 TaxID=2880218 RepID=UPI00247943A9|nr:hypothetical protein [Paraburkholderia sp. D15]WGS55100.1 hypothetical protein LFL96_34685 [Paraburkholderia sp. D15]
MSTSKGILSQNNPSAEFDPTRLEGASGSLPATEPPGHTAPTFGNFVPTEGEISAAARSLFGTEIPESAIRTIIQESEEVAHSTRKILLEHMRIGGYYVHILTTVVNSFIASQGDRKAVRDKAAHLAYTYIQRVHQHSKSSVGVYTRIYDKFASNSAAVQSLTRADMALLIRNDTPDELVDLVINAKTGNPEMPHKEVKLLVESYRKAQDEVAAANNRLETMNIELSNAGQQLDEEQSENRRLREERDRLQASIDQDRRAADAMKNVLASHGESVSALQRELSERERELRNLHQQLADAQAKTRTEQVEVPKVPDGFKTMEDAIEDQIRRKREITSTLETKQDELVAAERALAEKNAEIEASLRAEQEVNALIDKFGAFTQQFTTAQLLVTAEGSPTRYLPLFQGLADLVGKFHSELVAVTRAA